jgi:pimeloyl-ACP methyl ester carboxylesterase
VSTITTQDGTQIYYKDWGTGQPVVFSHGWPLSADSWEAQMLFLAANGYRCIAHDRRGHGRGRASPGVATRWTLMLTTSRSSSKHWP